MSEKSIDNVANMENFEMLKALYDFQAVYPKTISFDEGEYFILYQTSAKQRNWWQVVSMKGNIGFVPSNYVKKLKVEPTFLVSFLDSSIESLKQSKESEVNGIISKQELLQRLKDKKRFIEHSIEIMESKYRGTSGEKVYNNCTSQSPPPIVKKLESTKKSLSSPAVGTAVPPQMVQESPSMGVLCTKLNDVAQDNSITSETTSETTTTTTTTSEEVVTICKEEIPLTESNNIENGRSDGHDCQDQRIENEHGHGNGSRDGHDIGQRNGTDDYCTGSLNDAEEDNADDADDDETQNDLTKDRVYAITDGEENTTSYNENDNENDNDSIAIQTHDVYQIVDIIRRNTNLSFELSCEAFRVVIASFEELFPGSMSPYLEAVAVHLTDKLEIPKELLGVSHDAKRLQYIFSQLTDCKNDTEQRSWMLYEDEEDIIQFLEELVDILKNADEKISCHEMSCDQYQSLINLVQYYQMETRWPIKQLLLKAFTAACHLDHIIVDILLTSVLPLEIVEDMRTNSTNLEKFKELAKMFLIIFSLGQPMPVNHQEFLGISFVTFLFETIEDENNPETLIDLVITLLLAFNLQFNDFTQNIVIEAIQKISSVKTFTEKILLLLNREEDPVQILKHSTNNINSVLKMFVDLFSLPETAGLFYTNDNKVLIDILVRQLSDLSAGDRMRRYYLELCRRILRNTNYAEHTHRKQDLMKIFTRIFCEETECSASDQQLVRDIANEFPQIFKA